MELTTGKQLHLGNYPKNINNNKLLFKIWIQLRGARKEKKNQLVVKAITPFIYHRIDNYHAVVFLCVQWHLRHPALQGVHAIQSIQRHSEEAALGK